MSVPFVKLLVGYYLDEAVADGSDAAEVMFTRGIAYCGAARTGGRIPRSVLPSLTRKPATALKTARQLAAAGLWTADGTAFRVTNWDVHQNQLDALERRRTVDKERKRRQRQTRRQSRDTSADGPCDVTGGEIEVEVDAASAAADAAAAAAPDLDPAIDVFRSKLQQYTALSALRFDTLTADQADTLAHLIDVHGDSRLVRVALDTYRHDNPPVFVTAFFGTWAALPAPGKRLQAVTAPPPPAGEKASAEAVAAARNVFENGRRTS